MDLCYDLCYAMLCEGRWFMRHRRSIAMGGLWKSLYNSASADPLYFISSYYLWTMRTCEAVLCVVASCRVYAGGAEWISCLVNKQSLRENGLHCVTCIALLALRYMRCVTCIAWHGLHRGGSDSGVYWPDLDSQRVSLPRMLPRAIMCSTPALHLCLLPCPLRAHVSFYNHRPAFAPVDSDAHSHDSRPTREGRRWVGAERTWKERRASSWSGFLVPGACSVLGSALSLSPVHLQVRVRVARRAGRAAPG